MAASPPPSAATADEFVPDLHLIPREHDNLLSQVPQQGLDFLGSATFYKAMVEAAREANTLLLFNVENKDAVTEFRRFLTLKILVRDTMADQISPTPLMDAVWHQLILNTQVYEELQTRIGLKLHHRPSGASDAEAGVRIHRLGFMKALYSKFFERKPFTFAPSRAPILSTAKLVTPEAKKEGTFMLEIKLLIGRSIFVEMEHGNTIDIIKLKVQDNEGAPRDQQRLIFRGRELADSRTCSYYGIGNGEALHLVFKPGSRGC